MEMHSYKIEVIVAPYHLRNSSRLFKLFSCEAKFKKEIFVDVVGYMCCVSTLQLVLTTLLHMNLSSFVLMENSVLV